MLLFLASKMHEVANFRVLIAVMCIQNLIKVDFVFLQLSQAPESQLDR